MKRKILALLLSLAMLLSVGGMVEGTLAVGISVDSTRSSVTLGEVDPVVTPTPEAEPTVEPEVTPEGTPEPTVEPEATPEATPAPTVEPEATPEATPAPDTTPAETPTPEVSPEETKECTCDPKPAEGEAHKEGCPLYVEPDAPLYDRLMAAETLEAFTTIVEQADEKELSDFTCEEFDNVEAHYVFLSTGEYPDYSPVVDVVMEIVNFDNVAPLVGAGD